MIARWSTGAGFVVTAAVVGLVIWVAGLTGLANRAESICLADTADRLGDRAYEVSRKLWLPSFECRLLGNAVDPIEVQHPLEAILTFGWMVVVPVLYVIVTVALVQRWARQPRHDTSGSQ